MEQMPLPFFDKIPCNMSLYKVNLAVNRIGLEISLLFFDDKKVCKNKRQPTFAGKKEDSSCKYVYLSMMIQYEISL